MSDVLNCIRKFAFKENEKHIAVALSGGADSMTLFTALNMLKEELGITVSAVHINHMLRGEESDRDEAFVRRVCKKMGVPLSVHRIDVDSIAREEKISVELAARNVRYEVFDNTECDALATAHNADDNFETVLFRMTRKTGVSGLCGIPERRGKYIRPLLYCSREEVERFCRENGVPFVTDSTNLSDDFTRNRLRHSVVPIMKTLNPSLLSSFAKTLELLKNDSDYLDGEAKKEFVKRFDGERLDVKDFSLLHKAISSRVISYYLDHFGHSGNYSVTSALKIAISGGRTELKNGQMIKCADGYLDFEKNKTVTFSVTFKEEDAEILNEKGKIHNLLLKNAIDCDKIVGSLKVRTRLSGDSISFSHRKVSKSLRKWMNEEKIEPCLRDILPVVADDLGAVWVYGGGVDSRVCADETTKKVIMVVCESNQNE